MSKAATTFCACDIVTLQVGAVPVQAPLHDVNADPAAGLATSEMLLAAG
jgi:hypothetical protein